jgi:hypothetical protein
MTELRSDGPGAITREGARIMPDNAPHNALRHYVTGAIERGEAEPITAITDDAPHIYFVRKQAGIAGQFQVNARVGYPDEAPRDVSFVGSVYGGPVVMISDGREIFVANPGRFGEFGEGWVRRFFAAS